MNKKEILSKAKQEGLLGVDDGSKHMKNHGRLIGEAMFSAVFVIIALFAMITKNQIDYGVRAMFFAFICGKEYNQWQYEKSKPALFFSIAAGIVVILNLVEVACTMFGVAL